MRKHDEIVIAADSLTTFGDLKLAATYDRSPEKIVHYRGTYVGLCGSAAHQLVFESLLKSRDDLDFSGRLAIFDTLRKLHPVLKDQHFLNPKEEEDDPYESTQITALVANGVRLTRIEPISPTLEDLYFAVRTKKPVAGEIAEDGGRRLASGPGDDDVPAHVRGPEVPFAVDAQAM